MSTVWIMDSESDDLQDKATKFHCWVMKVYGGDDWIEFTDEFEEIPDVLEDGDTMVAHSQFGHDLPLLRRLHGVEYDVLFDQFGGKSIQLIDSLALSREAWPDRPWGHGLEPWGKQLKILKPQIGDWKSLTLEQYLHRCREDVKINEAVFEKLLKELRIQL